MSDTKKYEVFVGTKSGDGIFFGFEGNETRLNMIIEDKKEEVLRTYYSSASDIRIKEVDEFGKHTVICK